jgi:hypothetical protein
MEVHYCRGWFRPRKVLSEPLTEHEARAAHDSRALYTALIGDRDHPRCFVEITGDSMAVEFLDAHLRPYVCYHFQERRPGMLFISMAIFRKFEGGSDKVREAVIYYYKEDGRTEVHKTFISPAETWEGDTTLDVSPNWEPYPEFGEYESITRLDRGLQLVH